MAKGLMKVVRSSFNLQNCSQITPYLGFGINAAMPCCTSLSKFMLCWCCKSLIRSRWFCCDRSNTLVVNVSVTADGRPTRSATAANYLFIDCTWSEFPAWGKSLSPVDVVGATIGTGAGGFGSLWRLLEQQNNYFTSDLASHHNGKWICRYSSIWLRPGKFAMEIRIFAHKFLLKVRNKLPATFPEELVHEWG